MFLAVFGMLIGSAAAADLEEHDFNGHFTLKVPASYWMGVGSGGHTYENDKGVRISYFTVDDVKKEGYNNFDDYIKSLGLKDEKADGNLTVFKDGSKNVVIAKSNDEMYIIKDKDLNEAKAIAASANFGSDTKSASVDNSTSKTSNTTSTGDMEKVAVGDVLKINAPKGSEFNNGSYYDGYWTVYSSPQDRVVIYHISTTPSGRQIDDAYYKEFLNNVTSSGDFNVSKDGNITVVDGVQRVDATHVVYVYGNNQIATVSSDNIDLSKEMAKSIEFLK